MAAPTIDLLPDYPDPDSTDFSDLIGPWAAALGDFTTQMQAFVAWTATQTFSEVQEKGTATIADDAVGVFTLPSIGGFADIILQPNGSFPLLTECVSIFFDSGTTPLVSKLSNGAGSLVDVISGASNLAGTTGSDGKLTVAVDSSGDLRIENRLGNTRSVWVAYRGA